MFVVVALGCLGVALLVHEGAHVIAARLLKVRVHRLAFGLGPRVLSRHLGGTDWVLRLLPVWAESAIETEAQRGRRWMVLLLFGPIASLAFGLGVLMLLYLTGTHVPVRLTIGEVQPGSEAARAQLLPGDRVEAVDGLPVETWRDLTLIIDESAGREVRLTVRRGAEQSLELVVTPRSGADGAGRIGISQQYVHRRLPLAEAATAAVQHAYFLVRDTAAAALKGRRVGPRGGGTSYDVDTVVRALAAVSLLLGLLHLTPLPPLDLGVALVALLERRRGAPFSLNQRAAIQLLGFALIAAAAVMVARSRLA